jgi:pyridoxine kinase
VNILSLQSWVAYGHVGNASAMFPLQRLGAEVWAVNTVQFSNHPGYGRFSGEVFSGAQIEALVRGIEALGVLGQADAVLSGYVGDAAVGGAILDAVRRVRGKNPAAIYCCDPVIGDSGPGVYVRPGIGEFLRDEALAEADIATPNQFELTWLTGMPIATLADARAAVAALQERMRVGGLRCVLLTSLMTDDTPEGCIDMLAAEGGTCHLLRTQRLPALFNGAGDALAGLFLLHRLRSGDAAAALGAAGAAIHGVLRATVASGARELQLIAAQDELVSPSRWFPVAAV